jgi:hypothetical protein
VECFTGRHSLLTIYVGTWGLSWLLGPILLTAYFMWVHRKDFMVHLDRENQARLTTDKKACLESASFQRYKRLLAGK